MVNDFEIFLEKISKAVNNKPPEGKNKNMMGLSKKSKKPPVILLPSTEEYISALQKIKYGLNLLVSAFRMPSEGPGWWEKKLVNKQLRPYQRVCPGNPTSVMSQREWTLETP